MSPPVQELRSAYKLPSHVIANPVRTLGVAIPCRNYRMHINLQPEIATGASALAMTKWAVDPFLIVRSTPQSFTIHP